MPEAQSAQAAQAAPSGVALLASDVITSLVWSAGILALFFALAARCYRDMDR